MDLLKKLGEVSLWNDEIGEGLMTKKIKSKLDGKFFIINQDVLGSYSKWNHSKRPLLTHAKKIKNITSQKSRNSRTSELVNLKNA